MYSNEPLEHRHPVIYEAAGMASDFATYLSHLRLADAWLAAIFTAARDP